MYHQFVLEEFCHFHYSIVVFSRRFPELERVNGNAGVDVVMKSQDVILVGEVPGEGIEIIFFIGETDLEIVGKDVGYFVKPFQATVIIDDCFGAAKVGA